MADRIDRILRSYFTGRLDLMIIQRNNDLRNPHVDDEDKYLPIVQKGMITGWKKVYSRSEDDNIGGGRAQNKHTRPLEDMMIHIESDPLLSKLNKQKEDIERWVATFEKDKQNVMRCYYSSKSITWAKVSQQCHVGESTARAYRTEVKHILATVL
nr:DUF722 domain-containing protein [Leuconostoc gelidum]